MERLKLKSDKNILEVNDLQTYFRTENGVAKAVDGVSFAIKAGETYAIVGESGSGKSVTALSVMQLVAKPSGYIAGGEIVFNGDDLTKASTVAMREVRGNQISMIFQEPMTALNPVFTVGNQLAEVLALHRGMKKDEARTYGIEMLDKVGISDPDKRYDEYPFQLSGGMRQRVMIAIALACRPDLLIADEPTTALDVTIQSQILDLIRSLQKEFGLAVLLITHDMGVVRENADRVGVMYGGRIVEDASCKDLFDKPSHPYTQMLMKSLPSRGNRSKVLQTIKGMVPQPTEFTQGCRFNNRCPVAVEQCRQESPILENIDKEHTTACFMLGKDGVADLSKSGWMAEEESPGVEKYDYSCLNVESLKMHFPIKKGFFKKTIGHVRAVDGLDLAIKKGETVGLVGESGCGKTTVGKCIVRLLDSTSGKILFGDNDLSTLSGSTLKQYRRRIQMIFQDPFSSLNPRLKISDTITEGMQAHSVGSTKKERRDIMFKIMERVGLDSDMADRYPHEFSGGQRQRIGLARALAVEPELIVCDEATSSLDVSVQAQILNLLKELQVELGLSYLFISHDLSVVHYLADRVAVMYLGKIVEVGDANDVIETPQHPYTKALIAAIPQVDDDNRERIVLPGDVPSPSNPPSGCAFHPRCELATEECSQKMPSLESISGESNDRLAACWQV